MTLMIAILLSLQTSTSAIAAPVPADYMTCGQAVAQYETYKRVYVIAHGKHIIPLYGMTPIRRSRELNCFGRTKTKLSYSVNTRDNEYCRIAVYCR